MCLMAPQKYYSLSESSRTWDWTLFHPSSLCDPILGLGLLSKSFLVASRTLQTLGCRNVGVLIEQRNSAQFGEDRAGRRGAAQKSGKGFWPLYPSVLPAVLQVEPGSQNSRSLAMLDPLPPNGLSEL